MSATACVEAKGQLEGVLFLRLYGFGITQVVRLGSHLVGPYYISFNI